MEFQQALDHHLNGRLTEAAHGYEQILRADPAHLEALIHLGVLRLSQGHASQAEALLRRATIAAPDSPEAMANLAGALQALGRHEDAARAFDRALLRRPDMLEARFGLATCQQALGRDDAAIASYARILATDPGHAEANFGVATLLARHGRTEEAEAKYRAALASDPDFAEAGLGLGRLLTRRGAAAEALEHFTQALDVDPDYHEARAALGTALARLHRDEEAAAAFEAVLEAEPDNREAHLGLGGVLERDRWPEEAVEHYRAVLADDPDNVDATAGLATCFRKLGDLTQALAHARKVLAARPDQPAASALAGSILAEMGSIEEALGLMRDAVSRDPNRPDYAYYLTELAKVRPGDPVVPVLEAMLPRLDDFAVDDQCLLLFALAKALDDLGEKDRAFAHLLRGNAIKRTRMEYREPLYVGGMERIARVFTPALLAARAGGGAPSDVPVFIIGMPRSGTTLIEQTLASHPAVFGAGERSELGRIVGALDERRIGLFPESVPGMSDATLRGIGEEYVTALHALAPDARRIVDKMPANFAYAGLIRLVLPNAKIIHAMRDPVDTCLSCFSKLFSGDQPFAYDLAELGRYYRGYRRLMAHWRAVLPPAFMLEVEYEQMVGDFETQARRIVAHCGLPWDPACLDFHKTARPVQTASLIQVRQPIYKSSVGRWRPDPALLRPLLDALEGETAVP